MWKVLRVVNLVICLEIVLINLPLVVVIVGIPLFLRCAEDSDEGHNSKECDKPLTEEFLATITCRQCEQTGHMKSDCPEKPKFLCSNCGQEGHRRSECSVSSPPPAFFRVNLVIRNRLICLLFSVRNVKRWVTMQEIVQIRSVVIVRNQGIIQENVLYSHLR
jgi:Zinc knuckle